MFRLAVARFTRIQRAWRFLDFSRPICLAWSRSPCRGNNEVATKLCSSFGCRFGHSVGGRRLSPPLALCSARSTHLVGCDMKKSLLFATYLLLTLSASWAGPPAQANQEVYRRQRQSHRQSGVRHGRGYGHRYPGYSFFQPQIVGSWYARPYPYHFDYFRWRYSEGNPAPALGPAIPDCPLVETLPSE